MAKASAHCVMHSRPSSAAKFPMVRGRSVERRHGSLCGKTVDAARHEKCLRDRFRQSPMICPGDRLRICHIRSNSRRHQPVPHPLFLTAFRCRTMSLKYRKVLCRKSFPETEITGKLLNHRSGSAFVSRRQIQTAIQRRNQRLSPQRHLTRLPSRLLSHSLSQLPSHPLLLSQHRFLRLTKRLRSRCRSDLRGRMRR